VFETGRLVVDRRSLDVEVHAVLAALGFGHALQEKLGSLADSSTRST
jgi:hypothetical protein